MYKGILKILLASIHGLDVSVSNQGIGGIASAFQLLEIAHTHFWSKVIYILPFYFPGGIFQNQIHKISHEIDTEKFGFLEKVRTAFLRR